VHHPWFDRFIILCIFFNSAFMALFDYSYDNECAYRGNDSYCKYGEQSTQNKVVAVAGYTFSFIFVIESMFKIFALGFISGKKTYLKSGWNILDFVIVLTSFIEIALELQEIKGINMKALRMLRLLRPLKAMKTIPVLRKQVSALIMSIKGILNVIIFLAILFFVFSIVGL
jgi:voltage-dependent calcium channel T type alpha-1G